MELIVIAQFFALFGLILNVMSTQQEEKKKILLFNGLSNFASSIQYVLLQAYTGAVSCIVATLRNVVFGKIKKVPLYVLIIYYIIAIGLNIPAYNGLMSLIPVFNIMIYGYGIWQDNVKVTKLIIIIVSITGIIYDAYNLAIVNCLSSILSGTGAIVGYIRYIKQKEEDKIIV